MKQKRKKERAANYIWTYEEHRKQNNLAYHARPHQDGPGPERRRNIPTLHALRDLFDMTEQQKIVGLAAVAIKPDGNFYLVVSGSAMTQNMMTIGAVSKLTNLLHKIDEDDEYTDVTYL